MAIFDSKVVVLEKKDISVGAFDLTADGFYRNVITLPFKVKKRRAVYVNISADNPVDIAVANENGSSVAHKQFVTEGSLGPVPTGNNSEMGLFIAVYPGDKATVNAEVWMERL